MFGRKISCEWGVEEPLKTPPQPCRKGEAKSKKEVRGPEKTAKPATRNSGIIIHKSLKDDEKEAAAAADHNPVTLLLHSHILSSPFC
nr:hypothetical protein Itr_chr04CG12520 [Ipomoea trifida]